MSTNLDNQDMNMEEKNDDEVVTEKLISNGNKEETNIQVKFFK